MSGRLQDDNPDQHWISARRTEHRHERKNEADDGETLQFRHESVGFDQVPRGSRPAGLFLRVVQADCVLRGCGDHFREHTRARGAEPAREQDTDHHSDQETE